MSNSLPYIGSKISLITNNEIRYEGTLYTINAEESTIALQNVKSFGSEDRKVTVIAGSDEVYDFIVFRGKDIKDLSVLDGGKVQSPALQDPAIVSVNKAPVVSNQNKTSYDSQGGRDNKGRRGPDYWEKSRSGYGKGYGSGYGKGRSYGKGKGYKGDRGRKGGYSNKDYGAPVGELQANANEQMKSKVKTDFDFESALGKFSKPEALVPEAKTVDGSIIDTVLEGYDREKSFFDNISCDVTGRKNQESSNVQDMRDKLRALDKETFGDDALKRPFPNTRRGKGKGRGYRRNW